MSDKQSNSTQHINRPNWPRRIFLLVGLVAAIFILLQLGKLYQETASRRDRENHPPPGKLVDVNGIDYHINCIGNGSPTVILETGLAATSIDWIFIHEEAAQTTRVCAYDRAGLGWSEPAAEPMVGEEIARALRQLLVNAGEQGPYVMVGHSIGGVYVRNFAQLFPNDVVGMVLLDSSHENQIALLPDAMRPPPGGSLFYTCDMMAPYGIPRLQKRYRMFLPIEEGPPNLYFDQFRALMSQTHWCRTFNNELIAADSDLNRPEPPSLLGDMPLVVFTARTEVTEEELEGAPSHITYELIRGGQDIFWGLHVELSELSTNGEYIALDDVPHAIHLHEPVPVIDAISRVVAQSRERLE